MKPKEDTPPPPPKDPVMPVSLGAVWSTSRHRAKYNKAKKEETVAEKSQEPSVRPVRKKTADGIPKANKKPRVTLPVDDDPPIPAPKPKAKAKSQPRDLTKTRPTGKFAKGERSRRSKHPANFSLEGV